MLTPLVAAGLSKAEVRQASRRRGLRTADKPAAACLASRIAYGVQVTPARLSRVERAEALLRSFGLAQLRVRDHGDLARIEAPVDALAELVDPDAGPAWSPASTSSASPGSPSTWRASAPAP